jgi:hypothetical protein
MPYLSLTLELATGSNAVVCVSWWGSGVAHFLVVFTLFPAMFRPRQPQIGIRHRAALGLEDGLHVLDVGHGLSLQVQIRGCTNHFLLKLELQPTGNSLTATIPSLGVPCEKTASRPVTLPPARTTRRSRAAIVPPLETTSRITTTCLPAKRFA